MAFATKGNRAVDRARAAALVSCLALAACTHGSAGVGGGPGSGATAAICDDRAVLDGPSTAPAGAVVVTPGTDLSALVDAKPAGTTFWLAPGTHTLPAGTDSQGIPKDGAAFVGAPGAVLDGRHDNHYAFTQHARDVRISHLTIQSFGAAGDNNNEGVVNHDAGEGWVIEYSTIQGNAGAGVFLGSHTNVHHNCIRNNGQYGFSAYSPDGIVDVTLDSNEIAHNDTDDWEARQPGCGCTGGGKFWATVGARVTHNYVHDNPSVGIWADTNNVDFDVEGNVIARNEGVGLMYEISYNATVKANTFERNGLIDGPANPGFPTGAIYLSESGGDARAGAGPAVIEIADNVFVDNWSGVVLWENADRFCNSPANSSSGVCTLGGAASISTCASGQIASAPLYSDCRWKTQNVSVHDNVFQLDPAHLQGCTAQASCGLQGLFSNWGTYPSWSPYQGAVVEDAITFHQGNVFSHNTYTGPWSFMAHDQGTVLDFAHWQAAPYGQDAGSVMQ